MNENENKVTEVAVEEKAVAPVAVTEAPVPSVEVLTEATAEVAVEAKPVNRLTKAVKSQQFFTIAILATISYGLTFLYGLANGSMSIDIVNLLMMIGIWVTYSNAKNIPETEALAFTGPQLISGTVKAMRIISLVGAILCFVLGALLAIFIPLAANSPDFNTAFIAEFQAIQYSLLGNSFRFADDINFALIIFVVLTILMFILGIVLLVVEYIFFYRYLHKFTYSACENIKNNTEIEYTPALRGWLIVGAVLTILSSGMTFSVVGIAASGCSAAAYIIAALWFKNNFED